MAFLLLLHEKMRLRRKVNKLTLRQAQMAGRKERIANKISKVQKMYSNRMTQLEKNTQFLTSQFKNSIMQQSGIGSQGLNPSNFGGLGGISQLAMSGYSQLAEALGSNGSALVQAYLQGGIKQNADAKGVVDKNNPYVLSDGTKISSEQYEALQKGAWQIKQVELQASMFVQESSARYESNVSIWLEAQKAQLEEEQNAALLPLEAMETEIDLDNDAIETELTYARERLKNIEQACSQEIQSSAPKFGLG